MKVIRAGDVDSFIESQKAYAKLYDWITERVGSDIEKVRNVSISIGPKGSYFARCGTSHTHIAHALPKDLQTAIEESESPPLCIALGIKGAWILLRADGSRTWNLRQAYPGLASTDRLTDDSNPVVFAALSPFHENRYFLVTESGGCTYNTNTSDREEGERLHHLTDSYMRMRARKDGSTFTHSMTLNGVPRQVVITPKSAPDETKTDAWIAMLRARQKYLGRKDLAFAGAVAGGTGVLAKVVRMPTWRAVGVAASTGFGAGVAMWFREE
ncbi:hypothetical protein CC86DRAFT_111911 [Ophiobolus disseminans]|uniref:Uncharacterized protein n=1 Tax=Ophiobolus disseminans TaxID=1469910 RepID=A0A6A6ZI79_9PLEO|nr:hypothetical protein CC86DRAFT_111911 [Ophiobolus disseminans]